VLYPGSETEVLSCSRANDADGEVKCGFRGVDGTDGVFRPRRIKKTTHGRDK
jgi:hypothetical protein